MVVEYDSSEEEDVWVIDPPPPPKPNSAPAGGGGANAGEWSAEVQQMAASLDKEHLLDMCRKYGISDDKYTAFCPEAGWGPCKTPPEGSVCLYRLQEHAPSWSTLSNARLVHKDPSALQPRAQPAHAECLALSGRLRASM